MVKTLGLLGLLILFSAACRQKDPDNIAELFNKYGAAPVSREQIEAALAAGDDGLRKLDKYAIVSTQQASESASMAVGIKVGVGIMFNSAASDFPSVLRVVPGSPAAKIGLQKGDKIIAVNGARLKGVSTAQVNQLLAGVPGTTVDIVVERNGNQDEASLTRVPYKIPQVFSSMPVNGIGYLRVQSFSAGTLLEVKQAMSALVAAGARAVVLDLRYNATGILAEGEGVSRLFIGGGKSLFSTSSKNQSFAKTFVAPSEPAPFENIRLAVLVNQYTGSNAEVLALSLRENRKVPVIGEKTAGMASIQKMFRVKDNQFVQFTIATILSPSGKQIEGVGVSPDFVVSAPSTLDSLIKYYWINSPGEIAPNDPFVAKGREILAQQ